MKKITAMLLTVFLIFGLTSGLFNANFWVSRVTRLTVDVLQSEDILFLATNKAVTQIVAERTHSDPLLGSNTVYSIVPVRLVYGLDIRHVSEKDVTVTSNAGVLTISIQLPPLELLSCDVDFEKQKVIEKGNLLRIIYDRAQGENILALAQRDYQKAAAAFATENGLVPSREKVVQRIESFFKKMVWWALLENSHMVHIRFL